MHKDTLLRAIRGTKALTSDEALRLFGACGAAPGTTLYLALTGREDLAVRYMHHPFGEFLDALFAELPAALHESLDDRLDDLRPRWAVGAAKLVASLLAKRIREFEERDLALTAAR